MLKRKIILGITIAFFVFFAFQTFRCTYKYCSARRKFMAAVRAVPCDFPVDFTKKGVTRVLFHHTSHGLGHGVELRIVLPENIQLPKFTDSEIMAIFNEKMGFIRLFDGDKLICEWPTHISFFLESVPFCGGFPIPTYHTDTPEEPLPLKDYTLEFEIVNPTSEESFKECRLEGRYLYCGIEELTFTIPGFFAIITGIFSLILLSCIIRCVKNLVALGLKPTGNNILFLLSSYPRWSETFLRQDLRFLKEQGLPIHIATLFPGDCQPLPEWPTATLLGKPTSDTDNDAGKDAAAPTRPLPVPAWLRAKISRFKHRRLLRALIEECKTGGIGHIHAEFADLAALLASKAAVKTGCTLSIGIHAVDIHAPKYPNRRIFGHAAFVTVCNQEAAIAFKEKCPWAAARLHLIQHGIDLENWQYQKEKAPSQEINVLFIGRIVPKKGLPILLQALDFLANRQHQNVHLTIVGAGPQEDEIKELAAKLQVEQFITWTGRLDREQIQQQMQKASCLCMPSIVTADGDRDGIPNVVAEAMAAGLPVVGSQAGSLPEILSEESGWPVSELTPENLADAILDMASQPQETERRRINARNQIEFRFDARKLAEKRANLFRNVKTLPSSSVL